MFAKQLLPLCFLFPAISAYTKIVPNQLFSDHAVLQRDREVPVWGLAEPEALIAVTIGGQRYETVADAEGRWKVELSARPAGGPYQLRISSGDEVVEIEDILFGEVWLCSGQSNMEWRLRGNERPMIDAEREVAKATDGRFRYFKVERKPAYRREETVKGNWIRSAPEVAMDFSGVSFFFGRHLLEHLDVPIGVINSSWGGTGAESWTRAEVMEPYGELAEALDRVKQLGQLGAVDELVAREFEKWYQSKDVGSRGVGWWIRDLDTENWGEIELPGVWEEAGYSDYNGVVWFRKEFDLARAQVGEAALLRLGVLDYFDAVWVNGVQVGSGKGKEHAREYRIPSELLTERGNVVAVRVLDAGGVGGFIKGETPLDVASEEGLTSLVNLKGAWKCSFAYRLADNELLPPDALDNPHIPGVLYNGMIAPLMPYGIRGVAWYQGESNARRAKRYRELFPAMIADWRKEWGLGDFPFLYVQIAPYVNQTPEIREAQLMALTKSPQTAMVVTTDVGEAENIHPLNKKPVGDRLGLAARVLAYGEGIEYSGPIYTGWKVEGSMAEVSFSHAESGLVAPGGRLKGFMVAGADGIFYPAEAEIVGTRVEVRSEKVDRPVAVRYGWANVPEVNLFNGAGLPASPFRTDID